MTKSKDNSLTLKDIYSETGITYRYFLNWRHALLAGYLVAIYGLASGYIWIIKNNQINFSWVVFLSGLLLSACFWGLKRRIRDLYQSCTNTGAEIERKLGINGIYSKLDSPELRNKFITHSRVLNGLFGIVTFGMLAGLIYSLCLTIK